KHQTAKSQANNRAPTDNQSEPVSHEDQPTHWDAPTQPRFARRGGGWPILCGLCKGWASCNVQATMRRISFAFFALLISSASALCQSSQPATHQTVDVSSGTLHLKAYLWKPAGSGPFPAV